jgi:hypothetical protein
MTISYADSRFTSQTKDAVDHKGTDTFTSYPTYSMAILWNMNAHKLNADMRGMFVDSRHSGVPVDGDALARSAARRHKNDAAWARLAADIRDAS